MFLIFLTFPEISLSKKNEYFELKVGAWSKHLGSKQEYNETHNLLGGTYNNISIFTFINSYNSRSYGISYQYYSPLSGNVNLGLSGGLLYGYGHISGYEIITPYVAPYIDIYIYDFGLALSYVPAISSTTDGVILFSSKIKFKI
ncbi:hypothetical protein [Vibrio paucivorans]